ncbi:MAG: phosphomannomutase/phosphoglucomutase, partial [Acidobacteria bacterium]|nr:phosphomannomutase/phosphoglucomutase [Acidobacteriota bacterium]
MTHTTDPSIFKAYDVRGIYDAQITADVAQQIGRAFVAFLGTDRIAVGRDMRTSAPEIAAAFIDGALRQGADVVDYGLVGTDMLYYGVARDDHNGGAMITASHNPKEYIGMKLVRRQALPLSGESGIGDIRDMILDDRIPPAPRSPGKRTSADILTGYIEHVFSFIDVEAVRPFDLVLDAGSGIAGLVAPHLFDRLPCRTTRLCFEVDGTFP